MNNKKNGAPIGVITEETELVAEAPAPALSAPLAPAPAPAPVATSTSVNTGEKSEPITDAMGVPITSVGYSFEKHFNGHGWFKGKVVKIRPGAMGGKDRRCEYEDGDVEDLSLRQLRSLHDATQRKKKNEQGKGGASADTAPGTLALSETDNQSCGTNTAATDAAAAALAAPIPLAFLSPSKEAIAPATKKEKVKYCKAPGAPKRFRSAFIFFTTHRHKTIRKEIEEKLGKGDRVRSYSCGTSTYYAISDPRLPIIVFVSMLVCPSLNSILYNIITDFRRCQDYL
jgi:hypothetical protein